ncbi:MAG TPA: hypothetical protein VEA37_07640, partial [Flavobacterium sp.]|nr:hypothetical protein [Flavobacterium sp.]
MRSIDLDGLEKFILTTGVGTNSTTGKGFAGRHLYINPDDPEGKNGLIRHVDANGKHTILNDPSRLSKFDREVYDAAMKDIAEGRWSGGQWKILKPGTDIGLQKPPTTGNKTSYRYGTETVVEPNVQHLDRHFDLDVEFKLSRRGANEGLLFKDESKAMESIRNFADRLKTSKISSIKIDISGAYDRSSDVDPHFGTAAKLVEARGQKIAGLLRGYGITVIGIN